MDDEDDDGISDTVFDDENNDENNILDEEESTCDGDGNNILEEGEIPKDTDEVEVVMESAFETGDEPGDRNVAVTFGDTSDIANGSSRNMDGLHGNDKRMADAIPTINPGVINDSFNGCSIPQPRGSKSQRAENTPETRNHLDGPVVNVGQIGGTIDIQEAHGEIFRPFIFQSDPGPKLNFNLGSGFNGKRRRTPSPTHTFSNKKTHTTMKTTLPETHQNSESPQSPSIDLNRCIPHSESIGTCITENSPNESVNELARTVEIG
ncbi:hypothetical protein L2E82_18734 [Cichorium intybus]|uniref:Uncharacterized protein n=1 Tax=Cichorium intybus TaxID=13427 RepID=A0ACB9FAR2_CICIN|nr:hypothetical protein L2E82_18734 [Cichorium intybus]